MKIVLNYRNVGTLKKKLSKKTYYSLKLLISSNYSIMNVMIIKLTRSYDSDRARLFLLSNWITCPTFQRTDNFPWRC